MIGSLNRFRAKMAANCLKQMEKTVTFDTPENLEALKLWADLMITHKTSPVLRPWILPLKISLPESVR
jgi:hypothetical protein